MNWILKLAVKILIDALRKDEGLYYAYQANIAVSFQDEMRKENEYKTVGKLDIHAISNNAAKRFLDLFIGGSWE